ncbi:hypothetical protein CONCODRAFT_12420 [Conidiobolus coronatus NRRL 28638]|uniref:Uncharacterized protein n=1 Tax=Conidiobolus coronatus (strain ATCC 28846 / CBS 209.66 / NRRL 28638) TaxID=796925 RepID=A0A137NT42_CONC2|nr:hypothetical protein CONCODRAFT_12420 [Conidiobolus coronatus NRRL 28638]|eukprot:KXN65878.1 hypothetical protein CONCODRAFT_12420 [Conidiobolus coronatus NRRL 28638]
MQVINVILIATITAIPFGESVWSNNNGLYLPNFNQFDSPTPSNRDGVQFVEENSGQFQDTPLSFEGFSRPNFNSLQSEPEAKATIAVDPQPFSSWNDDNESNFNESEFPIDESGAFTPFINESPEAFESSNFAPVDNAQGVNEWDFNGDNVQEQESPFSTWNFSPENIQQFGNDGGFKPTQQPKVNKQFQSEQGQGQLGFYNVNL